MDYSVAVLLQHIFVLRVPLDVQRNFGVYVIEDKIKFLNDLFKINPIYIFAAWIKYSLYKIIIIPHRACASF